MSVTFTTIDFPGAEWTQANGISRHGPLLRSVQIVGTFADAAGTHGFLYSNGHYTRLDVTDGHNTAAYGINGRGQIVGTYEKPPWYPNVPAQPPRGVWPFILDSGTYSNINPQYIGPPTHNYALYGINNAGDMVGGFVEPNSLQVMGFVTRPPPPFFDFFLTEGLPAGGEKQLYGINSAGKCVGIRKDPPVGGPTAHGFYRQGPSGGDTGLADVPGADATYYRGINDAGHLCGYASFGRWIRAFVVGTSFTTFQFPGARWTQAHGISNPIPDQADTSFQVVGSYYPVDSNQSHGFMATLSPPHIVKWDGRDFIELELAEGAVFRVDGPVVPAGQQAEPTD